MREGCAHFDHLVGRREGCGWVHESGTHAPRTGRQTIGHGVMHLPSFGRGRRPVVEAERGHSHGAVADQRDAVHRGPRRVEPIEEFSEAPPFPVEIRAEGPKRGDLFCSGARIGRKRCGRVAAVADDLARHPLADRVQCAGISGQSEVRVGVKVDESRRDDQVVGTQPPPGRYVTPLGRDRDDAAV